MTTVSITPEHLTAKESDMADSEFDGHPLTKRQIKITRAGDGLSEALKLENVDLEADQQVTVVLRGKVEGATFKRDKDDDGYVRIDNIVAKSARIVEDSAELEQMLDEHDAAIADIRRREDEAKKGVQRIPGVDEDQLQAAEDGLGPADAVPAEPAEGSPRNPHGLRAAGE